MRSLRSRVQAPASARRSRGATRPDTPEQALPEAPVAEAGEPDEPEPGAGLAAERRLRDAGGPEDEATYACRCGAVFPASPTTSVSCPLCGVHQAW